MERDYFFELLYAKSGTVGLSGLSMILMAFTGGASIFHPLDQSDMDRMTAVYNMAPEPIKQKLMPAWLKQVELYQAYRDKDIDAHIP